MGAIIMIVGLWFSATFSLVVADSPVYSVVDFGAVGNGMQDATKAFMKTWEAVCADSNNPTFLIPSGGGRTFLLSKLIFWGPCESNIYVQVSGNLVAPNKIWTSKGEPWIMFIRVNGLTVDGHGELDGRGAIWWPPRSKGTIGAGPYILQFIHCDNLQVSGIYLKNSPDKHLVIYRSKWVKVYGLTITAPADSPNTDGMLITDCRHVDIWSSTIGVGDDCIAIGPGSRRVNISKITCGPGHGISIGSLGPNSKVGRISVSNSSIFQTTTGVRIKTWQGASGYARHISYDNIQFNSVDVPIVIDQFYCPRGGCSNKTSAVAIRDVTFNNLHGTSVDPKAIEVACSGNKGCRRLTFKDVSFTVEGKKHMPAQSFCFKAYGKMVGKCIPELACLK